MNTIKFTAEDHAALQCHFFEGDAIRAEQVAFAYAAPSRFQEGQLLLVRELLPVPAEALAQGIDGVELDDEFKVKAVLRARENGLHLIEMHTHPMSRRNVRFSSLDDEGQVLFQRYLGWKLPGRSWAALVFGRDSVAGALWEPGVSKPAPVDAVAVVGSRVDTGKSLPPRLKLEHERYGRQVIFGSYERERMAVTKVGIVGLGGLGSVVAQQLAYLGSRDFVLVDDDGVETTNLNRLVGAQPADVGRFKVHVVGDHIRGIAPHASVEAIPAGIRTHVALAALKTCDVMVGTVDNDGARALLTEFAAAFLIPYLDAASDVRRAPSGGVEYGGRVFCWWPGSTCLYCNNELDRQEMLALLSTENETVLREQLGYGGDVKLTAPSVVHVNSHVASSLVEELHAIVAGHRPPFPYRMYYGDKRGEKTRTVLDRTDCPICQGALGRGDFADIERYVRSLSKTG